MTEKKQGPELSAALDARDHPMGLEPGFPKKPRQGLPQTPPSQFDDEDSESAIPINPPAHPDGS
jgi:hypothetical protein